ncbi:hypothetical protein AXF42_Ash000434 [Apostasia shenzhenica]|uniref:Uncharacterized protein n=1 Tax=Apostasia shenzhenica TaxID=1088818 RepID=A0A2I0AG98_9ASPA|nr:hypothetical protein AXF42_Ash000434 [Apostasia shenzhenica]
MRPLKEEKLLGADSALFGRPIRGRHVYPDPAVWHTWRPLIGFRTVRHPNPITSPKRGSTRGSKGIVINVFVFLFLKLMC